MGKKGISVVPFPQSGPEVGSGKEQRESWRTQCPGRSQLQSLEEQDGFVNEKWVKGGRTGTYPAAGEHRVIDSPLPHDNKIKAKDCSTKVMECSAKPPTCPQARAMRLGRQVWRWGCNRAFNVPFPLFSTGFSPFSCSTDVDPQPCSPWGAADYLQFRRAPILSL